MSDLVRDARNVADVRDKSNLPTADISLAISVLKGLRVYDADLKRLRELRAELKRRERAAMADA